MNKLCFAQTDYQTIVSTMDTCLTSEEQKLYKMINEYRKSKGLQKIVQSKQLTIVAKLHARDLHFNRPFVEGRPLSTFDCSMHSWSENGPWTACCYTDDHKDPDCMWDKPSELTSYTGTGYEIAYGYGNKNDFIGKEIQAEDALDGWKNSRGHNPIIINKNEWQQVEWKAIGLAIFRDFAIVWFGSSVDESKSVSPCE